MPALLVLTLADLWIVGMKPAHYQTPAERTNVFEPTGTVQFLQQDKDIFRIMPLQSPLAASPNWWAYFKLQNAHGYHPAKLKVYQDLLEEPPPRGTGTVGLMAPLASGNFNLLRMTNVRYLIMAQEGLEASDDLDLAHVAEGMAPNGQRVREYVYRLTNELPRAWFVDTYRVVPDPKALLTEMADPRWDPAEEALLLAEPGTAVDPGSSGTVTVTEHRPHHLKAQVSASGNKLLVLSEVYYPPGWKATLDGQEIPILRTNHAFRGLVIPAGTHTLALDFSDPAYTLGRTLSFASYGLIGLVLAGGYLDGRLKRRRAGIREARGADDASPAGAVPASRT
jgi:hypothetical protein